MREETKRQAVKLASLLQQYGASSDGTWQDRKQALVDAINNTGESGAAEVLGWFDADTKEID